MTTYKRICIKDFCGIGKRDLNAPEEYFTIHRGDEFITSDVDENGEVMVFSSRWFMAPVSIFAGEVRFT